MAVKPGPELILALGKKAPVGRPSPAPVSAPAAPNGDLKAAMQEFIDAVQSGDVDGATEAFESCHRICSSYE